MLRRSYAEQYGYTFESLGKAPEFSDKGDFNGDNKITVADAVLLVRFAAEDTALTNEQIKEIMKHEPDYHDDGLVTILDAAALLHNLETADRTGQ